MDIGDSNDTLLLTAEGPVEKTLTFEEGEVTHRDVEANEFTARTLIEGYQKVSVTVSPKPDLTNHIESQFEDNHGGLVSWIFASYLDNADEEWYPIRTEEWDIELTTAKPGEHPDNLLRLCAEEKAKQEDSTTEDVLRIWVSEEYFDTTKVREALRIAESG